MGRKQDVGHLRSFGCVGYARVPEELIKSKLDPQLVKYAMVGYSSHGYRLYNKNACIVVTSQDIIFEEGTGHQTLVLPDEDDLISTAQLPNDVTTPTSPYPRQQVAPRIRPTDGPLHAEPVVAPPPEAVPPLQCSS